MRERERKKEENTKAKSVTGGFAHFSLWLWLLSFAYSHPCDDGIADVARGT